METNWYRWFFDHTWAIEVAVAFIVLLLVNYLIKRVLTRAKKEGRFKDHDWREGLDYIILAPLRAFLWVLLISFVIDLIARDYNLGGPFTYVATVRNILIVVCFAWSSLRWKRAFHATLTARQMQGSPNVDLASLEMVGKIFTIGIVFVSLLAILQILGLNIFPLITFGGIGAAAIGIAGKDVIANFFGGFMLYITRPFTLGDWIELPQKQMVGNIEAIGWYRTSIRDAQKKPIYIPNAIFSTEILINLSRMTHRRIEEVISVRFTDTSKVSALVEDIRQLLKKNKEIDSQQPIHVFFKAFGSYSANIEVQAYTISTRYEKFMQTKQEVLLAIHALVLGNGGEMSYPTMSIEIQKAADLA